MFYLMRVSLPSCGSQCPAELGESRVLEKSTKCLEKRESDEMAELPAESVIQDSGDLRPLWGTSKSDGR